MNTKTNTQQLDVTTPTLGKGSSDGDDILRANDVARDLLRDAMRAMHALFPKSCDYQETGDGTLVYEAAEREHLARVATLKRIYDELTAVYISVTAQLEAQEEERRIEMTVGHGADCDCGDCK
jgi:hypothetical protein